MDRLTEMFLFSVLHIFYDTVSELDFWVYADNALYMSGLHDDVEATAFVSEVGQWLIGRRHCRYHWRTSGATRTVVSLLHRLTDTRRKMLFLVLVLCGANHRNFYNAWYVIAESIAGSIFAWNFGMDCTLLPYIESVLIAAGWLAQPRIYPVSSATAYRVGIRGLPTEPQARFEEHARRIAREVLNIFHDLRDLACNLPASLDNVVGMSTLQRMMFARYMEYAHEEQWTEFSGAYVPEGYTPSLAQYFLEMFERMPQLISVLRRVVGEPDCFHLYTPDHMAHMACEFRKFKNGNCPQYSHAR